jgi:trans-aconitate methyltransferase
MTEQTYTLSAAAAEFYETTFVPALFRPWAERLADAVAPRPGQVVVDVACGTGIVARTIAERLLSDHSITGVDANPAMLDVARRLRPGLNWLDGDAAELPLADATADLVTCQAALMFFPDRVAALREMARVTRPGGHVAVLVPGRLERSAGYAALADVVARHAGPGATALLAGYFAAGDPDLLARQLAAAGLEVERLTTWTGATRLASLDTFLDAELLPIADAVDQPTRDRIVADCRTALAPFLDPDGAIAAPIEAHLAVASRPLASRAGGTLGR